MSDGIGQTVRARLDGAVGVVELAGAEPNYVDPEQLERVATVVEDLAADAACRVLVLCASGRHFCAGANFGAGGLGDDRPAAARRLYAAAARLFAVDVPVVAAVQGAAVGAGLGLACAADFRVASSASRFHANFTRLGFHPGFGLRVTLPAIVGRQHAADLLYSGRRIDGERAAAIGLVDRLVQPGTEREAARQWADELAGVAPLALRSVKRTLRGHLASEVPAALEHELAEQTWLWQTDDCREGLAATAARRAPVFEGR